MIPNEFISIGKAPDNDWVIDLPHISAYHAVLVHRQKSVFIYDLASTNKLFINDQPVAWKLVSADDRISLGSSTIIDLKKIESSLSRIKNNKARIEFILLGSEKNNDWIVEDKHVSRYHAIAFRDESGVVRIVDLASTNKLYVNGSAVKKITLNESDTFSLGTNINLPVSQLFYRVKKKSEERIHQQFPAQKKKRGNTTVLNLLNKFIKAEDERKRREKIQEKIMSDWQGKTRIDIQNIAIAFLLLVCIVGLVVTYSGSGKGSTDPQQVTIYTNIADKIEVNRSAVVMVIHDYSNETLKDDTITLDKEPLMKDPVSGRYLFGTGGDNTVEGSGFLYRHQDDILVVTNKHVVQVPSLRKDGVSSKISIRIQGSSRPYNVRLLSVHPSQDIALLKVIDSIPVWTEVEVADAAIMIKPGDEVGCMSFPLGLSGQRENQIRADLLKGNIINASRDEIKHNITSAPGASGGPIFNLNGEVIAIIKGGSVDKNGQVWDINYALPITYLNDLLD